MKHKNNQLTLADVLLPRAEKVMPSDCPDQPYLGLDDIEAHTTKRVGSKSSSSMKSAAKRFYEGDVLYSRLRPYLNKVWRADRSGLCSAEFIVLPQNEWVDAEFLKYRLNARDFVAFANSLNAGDRPRVDFDQISSFAFPQFSVTQQKRIVEKIEVLFAELDAGEASLRQARTQLGVYRQALLKKAFSGELTANWRAQNPDQIEPAEQLLARIKAKTAKTLQPHACHLWRTIELGELTEYITSGSRGWAKYYANSGSLFIRAQNLKTDWLKFDDIAFVDLPEKVEGLRTLTKLGDLLITITGANVTKSAYVDRDLGDAYVSQHVALCRLINPELIKFLYLYIISPTGGRHDLEKAAYGAGKPGLNLTNIRELRVPICSLPEQKEIVHLLEEQFTAIEQNEREIDAAVERAAALRQSILKKAFSGKLVPQDPNDEPARILLERIRSEKAEVRKVKKAARSTCSRQAKKATKKRVRKNAVKKV